MSDHEIGTFDPLPIRTQELDELRDVDIEENRIAYLNFLEGERAIRYLKNDDEGQEGFTPIGTGDENAILYPQFFYVHVLDIRPIRNIENLYSGDVKTARYVDTEKDYRYFRVESDEFVYGRPTAVSTKIRFKKKKSLYYLIFKALFDLAPAYPDGIPYEKINTYLGSRGIPDDKKAAARIRAAIQIGLARELRALKVPTKVEGVTIITLIPGEGFKFSNPVMRNN